MPRTEFPLTFGTISGAQVIRGPFEGDVYYYALYFTTEKGLYPEEIEILTTFNDCLLYVGEERPTYLNGEYRRAFRTPIPTEPFFWLDNSDPTELEASRQLVNIAFSAYTGKPTPVFRRLHEQSPQL